MQQQDMNLDAELYPLIDSLIGLLKREIVVYRELQATIAHEKIILLKPSLERLLDSNNKKETVILKAKMLEEGRLKLIKRIAKLLEVDEDEINLSTLCSVAGHDQQADLKDCQSVLSTLLAENRRMNENNKDLLDYSLHFLQGSVDFIHNLVASASSCYMPSGRMKPVMRNGKLVRTEG